MVVLEMKLRFYWVHGWDGEDTERIVELMWNDFLNNCEVEI